MLPNLSQLARPPGGAELAVGTRYALFGNEKSDWGIMYFDDYNRYLSEFREWKQMGWLRDGEEPLDIDGVRKAKPPPVYNFTTRDDYKRYEFTDYDEYVKAREKAIAQGKLYATSMKYDRAGNLFEWKASKGAWQRVPYA